MLIAIEVLQYLKGLIILPLVCTFLCLIGQWAMVMNRKPGVKLFDPAILGNPLAIQFFGRRFLTESGIFWRNLSWISGGISLIYLVI